MLNLSTRNLVSYKCILVTMAIHWKHIQWLIDRETPNTLACAIVNTYLDYFDHCPSGKTPPFRGMQAAASFIMKTI